MSVEFKKVVPLGRCRLRNRVALERPLCSRDGPSPRSGASMTPAGEALWVFGGLAQYEAEDDWGDPYQALKCVNEMWSFNLGTQLWSWHGCEVRETLRLVLLYLAARSPATRHSTPKLFRSSSASSKNNN